MKLKIWYHRETVNLGSLAPMGELGSSLRASLKCSLLDDAVENEKGV